MSEQSEKIQKLNDIFRKTLLGGRVVLTQGVSTLPEEKQQHVLNLVREFNKFSESNDPYAEHDFGKVKYMGDDFFFKIDYYDKNLEYGSEDPSNPNETTRVLTIMFANEY